VNKSDGADDGGGTEQYARHGSGSLSGLRICISNSVRKMANIVSRRRVKTIVIGCRGKNGCRSSFRIPLLRVLKYPCLFLRLRLRTFLPIFHHLRRSSLHHGLRGRPPSNGELGSLSVSEVHDDDWAEEKKWGNGDVEREGTGVDVSDERPEFPRGGNKKFGPVGVEAGNGTRVLVCE